MSTAYASPNSPGALARLVRAAAGVSARRPKTTIALWLALLAACVAAGSVSGMRTLSNTKSGVGESAHADARLTVAGLQPPAVEDVLVTAASAAQTERAAAALQAAARRLRGVIFVRGSADSPVLSRDGGRTALVVVGMPSAGAAAGAARLRSLVETQSRGEPGVTMRQAGAGSFDNAINSLVSTGLQRAELISIPLTLAILVLAFGALAAASVPLLLGLTSVGAALGALGLVSQIAPNGSSTAPVVVLIGLAVGVDYSLFYIRRERAERRAGATESGALAAASATVGRAIAVAGATVMIGLAGLLFTGFGVFTSMALGAIVVVAIAVLGSLTVLPAMLSLLGDRIDRGRLPWLRPTRSSTRRVGAWGAIAHGVTRHPRASLVTAVSILAALAAPLSSIQTGNPGLSDLPAKTPVRLAAEAINRAFPGAPASAELVVTGRHLGDARDRDALSAIGQRGLRISGGHAPSSVRVAPDGETALVAIPTPQRGIAATNRTVVALRGSLEPAVARSIPGAHATLAGEAAGNLDFSNRLSSITPFVFAFVLGLALILLIATFGSARLALAVVGLNLLSVGAAFGILTEVFQHGWAQSLLGFQSDGAIVEWLPLFAFVVLFGLSMDYTVLVLEHAREARLAGESARSAAATALRNTGGTVTSAALVMVAVFSVFATLPLLEFKQLGAGLAAAIALDATIVRGVALPAALVLLGDRGLRPARVQRSRAASWDHAFDVAALGSVDD